MNKYNFLLAVFLLPLLPGCLDSDEYDFDTIEGIQVNPSYAFPVLKGRLGLKNLLNSNDSITLGVRQDDVLYFHYEQDFESSDINDMVKVPDAGINESLTLPSDITVAAYTEKNLFVINSDISLAGSQQFRSVLYKAGELLYSFNTTINLPLRVNITFPSIAKQGSQLTKTITINAASAQASSLLEGFEADLTTVSPGYNSVPFIIDVTAVNNTASDVVIKQGETVSANMNLTGQDYKLLTGFFGQIEKSFPGLSLAIGPFNDMIKHGISLAEIDLEMKVYNEYGIPIALSFPVFEAVKGSGEQMAVQTDPSGSIILDSPEAPGMETSSVIKILNGADIINFNPEELRYDVNVRLNDGLTSGNNFIADTSSLSFNLAADVPLIGSFREIVVEDTLEVDLKNDLEGAEFKRLAFKTKLVNQFPFEGNFQVYLLDEAQNITDSLFMEGQTDIIRAGTVTSTGDLSEPGTYDELIDITAEKFNKLSNAAKLIVKATLNTTPGPNNDFPHVKFKSNYTIAINLGILAELEANIQP